MGVLYLAAVAEGLIGILLLTPWWRTACMACGALMLLFMVLANRGIFPTCGCLGAAIHVDPTHRAVLAAILAFMAGASLSLGERGVGGSASASAGLH